MAGTATSVGAGEAGSGVVTSTIGQVDTVTFSRDVDSVLVFNYDGADWLWFTVDGSTPTVGGKNCIPVPPAEGAGIKASVPTAGNTAVKVTSASATKYMVLDGTS